MTAFDDIVDVSDIRWGLALDVESTLGVETAPLHLLLGAARHERHKEEADKKSHWDGEVMGHPLIQTFLWKAIQDRGEGTLADDCFPALRGIWEALWDKIASLPSTQFQLPSGLVISSRLQPAEVLAVGLSQFISETLGVFTISSGELNILKHVQVTRESHSRTKVSHTFLPTSRRRDQHPESPDCLRIQLHPYSWENGSLRRMTVITRESETVLWSRDQFADYMLSWFGGLGRFFCGVMALQEAVRAYGVKVGIVSLDEIRITFPDLSGTRVNSPVDPQGWLELPKRVKFWCSRWAK